VKCYFYKDFSLLKNAQTGSGAHPASNSKGTLVSSRGLSDRGLEVNLSKPPSSAQVNNEWISASASPTGLHGMNREYF
jgi:hypothetical protein